MQLGATGALDLQEATFSLPVVQGKKDLHECCFGDSAHDLAQHLTAAVESGLNVRTPASIRQVWHAGISLVLKSSIGTEIIFSLPFVWMAGVDTACCLCSNNYYAGLRGILPYKCCTAALSNGCARSICAIDTIVRQEGLSSALVAVTATWTTAACS